MLPKGNATDTEVAKATPYLMGKLRGDNSMVEKRADRESTLTWAVQLSVYG
jgi:hypothetical protein